jgi:hypothetical protein
MVIHSNYWKAEMKTPPLVTSWDDKEIIQIHTEGAHRRNVLTQFRNCIYKYLIFISGSY